MSIFPRIDPNHPLTEAARYVNSQSEEFGLEKTIEWLEMGVGVGELAYLSEQRALRAVAAAAPGGVNLGSGAIHGLHADLMAMEIMQTPLWKDMRMLLIGCYMDGLAIGWKARELHDQAAQDASSHDEA